MWVWDYPPLFCYAVDALLMLSHTQAMAALLRCHTTTAAVVVVVAHSVARVTVTAACTVLQGAEWSR